MKEDGEGERQRGQTEEIEGERKERGEGSALGSKEAGSYNESKRDGFGVGAKGARAEESRVMRLPAGLETVLPVIAVLAEPTCCTGGMVKSK